MVIKSTDIMPVTTISKAPTATIKHIIFYAVLPKCSPQLKTIQRQELMDVTDFITLTLDDINEIKLVNDDAIFAAKQLQPTMYVSSKPPSSCTIKSVVVYAVALMGDQTRGQRTMWLTWIP
jgi:hypothetical protein